MVLMHLSTPCPLASLAAQPHFGVRGVCGAQRCPGSCGDTAGAAALPCAGCSLCRQPGPPQTGSKPGKNTQAEELKLCEAVGEKTSEQSPWGHEALA